ncbi:MAG TPA: OsmC family protein [Candidatus Binatia bacterium]|nr:OsmC family protein [Candidatus Binatia bacterium]
MSEPRTYYYETEVEWKSGAEGSLGASGLAPIDVGAPPEFDGRAGVWSPEHLFVAALNSCYMLTFLAVARFSKVEVVRFSSTATGKLEKGPGGRYQITEIVVKPRIVIGSASDLGRMPRLVEKAKENCFVSNSIQSAVKVLPDIFHQQAAATPCPLGASPPSGDS